MSKESIWTRDIAPDIVKVMTMDITPDFSSDVWTQDITHHVVGTLAVFGLVVSAFVTTLGVAAAGVNVELAFSEQATQQAATAQTAAIVLAEDNRPAPGMVVGTTTTMGTTTPKTALFCPKIVRTVARGRNEATTAGDVGQLQQFIASHFGLDPKDVVSGHFGSTTEAYLRKFQQEQGIPPTNSAGPLTRSAIARLCNPSSMDDKSILRGKGDVRGDMRGPGTTGSTTSPMLRHDDMRSGSTTNNDERRLPPPPPMPPKASTSGSPSSYYAPQSNAASVVEAINQISDGYAKLLGAGLSLLGL